MRKEFLEEVYLTSVRKSYRETESCARTQIVPGGVFRVVVGGAPWPQGLFGTRWPPTLQTSFPSTSRTPSSSVGYDHHLVLDCVTLTLDHTLTPFFDSIGDDVGVSV